MNQDPATGKFLPGNKASRGGGRPRTEAAEKLRVNLESIVSNGTLPKWRDAMKRKLEKGDPWATQFVFERIAGKVPDALGIFGPGDDGEFLIEIEVVKRLADIQTGEPAAPSADDGNG